MRHFPLSSSSISRNRSRSGTLKATDAATNVATVTFAVPCSILMMCFGWTPMASAACS